MKKFLTFILVVLFVLSTCALSVGCAGGNKGFSINYKNGTIYFSETENVVSVKVYANDNFVGQTSSDSFDVARAIIDSSIIPYGNYSVSAKGVDENDKVIAQSQNSISFSIKELNSSNLVTTLSGEYSSTDYFLFSNNVNVYGRGPYNTNSRPGYHTVNLGDSGRDVNSITFVKKAFTATIDGNGYSLSAIVDEHISWVGLPFAFDGFFHKVETNAVIKNMQVYLDFKYEAKSGCSANFVRDFNGTLSNVFVDFTSRPFVRQGDSQGNISDSSPYIDKGDSKASVIYSMNANAKLNDCIFVMRSFNLAEEPIDAGGAVLFSYAGAKYHNCIFVSPDGEERFFNLDYNMTSSGFTTPTSTSNIYFYYSIDDLVDQDGYKVDGALERRPNFVEYFLDPLATFSSPWSITQGSLCLFNREITVY